MLLIALGEAMNEKIWEQFNKEKQIDHDLGIDPVLNEIFRSFGVQLDDQNTEDIENTNNIYAKFIKWWW